MVTVISEAAAVIGTEYLTPNMLRVWALAPGFAHATMAPGGYARVAFTPDGSAPSLPRHTGTAFEWPDGERPTTRNLTVAEREPARNRVALDVVLHSEDTPLQRWARTVSPGHLLGMVGPGAGHRPDPTADRLVLAGDESAIPAVRSLLRDRAPGVPVTVVLEVGGPADRQDLPSDGGTEINWLERRGAPPGRLLLAHFSEWEPGTGDPEVWAAGEFEVMRSLRARLREGLGLARGRSVAVPYWRAGATHDDTDERIARTMREARRRSLEIRTTQDVNELYLDRLWRPDGDRPTTEH